MSAPSTDPAFLAPEPGGVVAAGGRPTFSVVVAAYRCAGTIGAAVRSALEQTEPPLEVVVCDDGSPDDLAAALAPFGTRVRLVRRPHAGAAAAGNVAAALAGGDFVVVLDADDAWDPRRLQRLGDLASSRPDLDLLTTDAWFVVDGRRRGRFYDANTFPVHDQATEALRRNFFFAHVAVRRSTWLALAGFRAGLTQGYDWDLWLRALLAGSRAGCVREPLADYTVHPDSLSADRPASLEARVRLLDAAVREHRLTADQRAAAAAARRTYLHRARAATAEQALLTSSPDRRRACGALLLTRGAGVRTRMLAAAALSAPTWAGRRLRRERARTGHARSDRRHERPDAAAATGRGLRARADVLLRRLPPARRQRWRLATAALVSLAVDGRARRVLDAGCGDGLLTLDLAERFPAWSFLGVDLSTDQLRLAEAERRRRGLGNVAFACADLTSLRLRECVDVVLAMECLSEVADDRAAMRRLRAALRDDGVLLGHVPTADWRPVLPRSDATWRHEVRHGYTGAGLRDLAEDCGLRLVTRPTQQDVVTVAQELRDRWKGRPRRVVVAGPLLAAAARLDTAGLTWGPARGRFFSARPRARSRQGERAVATTTA